MCKYEWWEHFKTNSSVKYHVKTNFPYRRPLSTDSLLDKIASASYVQRDLIDPGKLNPTFSNVPPIFKNIDVCRKDIGEYMENYAEENNLLKNPQRMSISSFKLQNGTIISTLLNFYLSLGLQCIKIYRFVE